MLGWDGRGEGGCIFVDYSHLFMKIKMIFKFSMYKFALCLGSYLHTEIVNTSKLFLLVLWTDSDASQSNVGHERCLLYP